MLCLLFSRVHESPPTSSSIKAYCARLLLVSACCGDPLWSGRWQTCIDVLQTRHSCVNIEPGQSEAWPSAITVTACSGIRLFDQWLYFVTSDLYNSVFLSSHHSKQHLGHCVVVVPNVILLTHLCEQNHSRTSYLRHRIPLQNRLFDFGAPFCINLHVNFHKLIVFKTLCNYLQFRDQINTTWVMQKKGY